jgi:hypothetical protein
LIDCSVTLKINTQHTQGRPPFWRTLEEPCKGLGSVTLKINTQHTHSDIPIYVPFT